MSHKIYTYPDNPRVHKAVIAAKYANVPVEVPAFKWPDDLHTKEFLAKNPLAKVPVLETPQGCIFESNAIMRYFGRKSTQLYGTDDYSAGLVDQWIDFSVNEIELPLNVWVFPILGWMDFHHDATEKAKQDVSKALNILNQHLMHHTYLVGEDVTLADIAVCMALLRGFNLVFDPKFRKPFQAVNRWFTTCVRLPLWQEVLGEVKLAEEMAVAKSAPKQTKKSASALDKLPPSLLHLDDFKKLHGSSQDVRGDAMQFFWKHLDDGYSVWFGEFQQSNELDTKVKAHAVIDGFLHGLQPFHKYGMAAFAVFGDEPALELSVCFLTRGQSLPSDELELEFPKSFSWRKADVSSEADKELIDDFFTKQGKFAGRSSKLSDVKIFK